jgi:hypothetical protein
MAYIIYNNDGTVLVNIANGDIDSSTTSLDLIGKNVDNYGQYFNNDLVKLLTNFAAPTGSDPISPQTGQLWFNTTTKKLNVFDGINFNPTYGATVSGTAAISTSTGDLWYDTNNSQLKVWNGYSYKLVGPAVSSIYGKFGIEPPSAIVRADDTNVPQKVSGVYSYGSVIGLLTTSSFSLSAADGITYLNNGTTSTIVSGLTIANDLDIRGHLYIGGIQQLPSKMPTAYFNITSYGDPADPTTATAITNIESGNIAIGDFLPLIFTTATNISYNDIAFPLESEARVVCYFNNTPSVRRFRLITDPIHPGVRIWSYADPTVVVYYNAAASTLTNIVVL